MVIFQRLSLAFAAGGIGAVVNVLFVMFVGAVGIAAALGISAPPRAMPAFLYKQIVWGGLWGFVYVLPVLTGSWWLRGIVFGTLPALAALLIFFPMATVDGKGPGLFGTNFGDLTFIVVFVANWVWGLATSWWYDRVSRA